MHTVVETCLCLFLLIQMNWTQHFHADLFSHRINVRLFFFYSAIFIHSNGADICNNITKKQTKGKKKQKKNEQTNPKKSTANTRVNIIHVPTFTGAQTPAEENLAAARFEF